MECSPAVRSGYFFDIEVAMLKEEYEVYLLSERWKVLSGSWLKVIAMVSMVIDHSAYFILWHVDTFTTTLFIVGHRHVTWFYLMRCVGRLAFPLFCFLIVEGFLHTHDRRKYGRNLLVFALLSEIPFDLARCGHLSWAGQNVFFTLFLGFLALCAIGRWEKGEMWNVKCGMWRSAEGRLLPEGRKNENRLLAVRLFGLIAAGILMHTDYGTSGVSFIILLYVLRRNRILQAAIGCIMLPMRWITGLAFIPINMYNGQRGFIQGPWAKYLFYVFYPLHLLVLYFIKIH